MTTRSPRAPAGVAATSAPCSAAQRRAVSRGAVPDEELEARAAQVGRHPRAHDAEADEADGSGHGHARPAANSLSFCGSRSGGPWPKQTSAGSSAASLRADSRLRAGSGVKIPWARGGPAYRSHVHVVEHVAEHEHAVGLAPVRDVAGRVPRHVEHREPRDLVALAQAPVDLARRARPGARQAVDPVVGLARSRRSPSRGRRRSPHHSGMPSASQTSLLAPW